MTNGVLRLLTWLSPAFPVGAFSYSHGLERAVHDGLVTQAEDVFEWLEALLRNGSGWNDAVLFAESWRHPRDADGLREVAELAEALAGSAERHLESTLQGAAFVEAARPWLDAGQADGDCAYCVAVGSVAGRTGVALHDALAAYLHAFASNLVQASIRLSVIGQKDGVALLARLEPVIFDVANRAAGATLDDLGSSTVTAEIVAMKHETQHSRLFRT